MTKIKVCYISLSAYKLFDSNSQTAFGGSELQCYLQASELAKDANFDVYFLVNDRLGNNDFKKINGVMIYRLKRYTRNRWRGNFLKSLFNFFNAIRKINTDVYIQKAAGIETGMAALFCKLFRKKFIYMTACPWDVNGEYVKKGLRGKIFLFGLKNADLIITQNEEQRKLLKEKFGLESIVVKNAFPLKMLSDAEYADKKFILWVSSSQQLKRPDLFLEITKSFPREKFIMIMPCNDPMLFKKIQENAKHYNNLEFIESVPFEESDGYFRKAKIFINTSDFEGFPNTFIQAAENKTPILSLNVNPDNILYSEKNKDSELNSTSVGFCANGDFNKMIARLKILLENKNLRQEMSENGWNYARENHDIKKIIEQDKKIIFNLLKPSLEPRP